MTADPALLILAMVLAGLLLVAVFVAGLVAADRKRLARRLERTIDNQRGGAHG